MLYNAEKNAQAKNWEKNQESEKKNIELHAAEQRRKKTN